MNDHLRRQCLAARERACGDNALSVAARFERDRAAARPAPARRLDACVVQPAQVDKYQTVRFDHNEYSVPRRWAFRAVTVKGYVDRVEVVTDGQVVAAHARSYGRGERVLDPLHFLVVLDRKPATLDHAPVYRDWQLPSAFAEVRRSLEARLGARTGARHYIRVLQLLAGHPLARVEAAVAGCLARGDPDAAAVAAAAERLARDGPPPRDNTMSPTVPAVAVPPPDLSRFDRLLTRSPDPGDADECRDRPAPTPGQPEAAPAADDARRVGEAGP